MQEYGPQNVVDGGLQTRWASQIDCPELIIKLNERDKFNKISIFEYRDGLQNRIQAYTIDIWQDNRWTTLYLSQSPMGACKVIHLPQTYQTSQIRLKVLAASAPPSIYEFSVIHKE
ncbi:MAG: discoidin domain-containing protein [Odoribacter splanchnicus]